MYLDVSVSIGRISPRPHHLLCRLGWPRCRSDNSLAAFLLFRCCNPAQKKELNGAVPVLFFNKFSDRCRAVSWLEAVKGIKDGLFSPLPLSETQPMIKILPTYCGSFRGTRHHGHKGAREKGMDKYYFTLENRNHIYV